MKITLVGNKDGVYINPVDNNAAVDYKKSNNYSEIKMYGVNHLVIRRSDGGEMKVIQAGGYNRLRGLFCDLY